MPDEGSLTAFWKRLSEESLNGEFREFFSSRVSLLFQNPDVQLFSPSLWDDVAFGPLQLGLEDEDVCKRVRDVLHMLSIEGLKDRAPHELSIGEKKKAAIASILSINPEVLLLDEPTSGLDPKSTVELTEFLVEAGKAGKTIITASHDLEIVPKISTRCYVIGEDKRIVAEGATEEILSNTSLLKIYNLI